jgi:protease I
LQTSNQTITRESFYAAARPSRTSSGTTRKLAEVVTAMAAAKKVVAAICLSTVVLAKAKLLAGREATVYYLPKALEELKEGGAKYVQETLIIHDNLILAEGPPDSQRFGQAIRTALS